MDGTHFQENGARNLAGFVADGLREAGLPLVSRSEGGALTGALPAARLAGSFGLSHYQPPGLSE